LVINDFYCTTFTVYLVLLRQRDFGTSVGTVYPAMGSARYRELLGCVHVRPTSLRRACHSYIIISHLQCGKLWPNC